MMENKQTDREFELRIKEIMMEKVPESEIVDKKLEDAYQEIRETKAKTAGKRKVSMAVKFSTAAAVLVLATLYCVKNPAFAAQLPLIGNIFRGLEGQVSYPGDYSKHSVALFEETDDGVSGAKAAGKDGAGSSDTDVNQSGGSDSDAAANQAGGSDAAANQAGSSDAATNQAGGSDAVTNQADRSGAAANQAGESDAVVRHTAERGDAGINQADHEAGGTEKGSHVQSNQAAEGSHAQSYRKAADGVTVTLSEAACDNHSIYLAILVENKKGFLKEALYPDYLEYDAQVKLHKKDGSVEIHDFESEGIFICGIEGEFTDSHTFQGIYQFEGAEDEISEYTVCELTFREFEQEMTTGETKTGMTADHAEVSWTEFDRVHYKGPWKFRLELDDMVSTSQEIIVNEVNGQGYGIEKIVKTAFEIYAVPILPKGEKDYDYYAVIWDADKEPLEVRSGHGFRMGVYGRDVSEVTVYLLKAEDYLDNKGEYSYRQPEKAVYQTTVRIEN